MAMPFGLAGYSRASVLAKAPDAASLDPILSDQAQRRRALWSFLTWAFLLAEASKDAQADATASSVSDDPDRPREPARDEASAPAPLTTDEPAPKDWSVALPAEKMDLGLGAHGLLGMPAATKFDPLERLSEPAEPEAPREPSGGGGRGHLPLADGDARTLAAGAADDGPADFGDAGASVSGLAGLDLPSTDGLVDDLLGSLALDLGDGPSRVPLPIVGDVVAVVTSTADGLLALTKALAGSVLASGGTISVDGLPSKLDLGLDDLFTGGRYTDYHLALQLGGPSTGGGAVSISAPLIDTLALDNLIPHVAPDQASQGDIGGTVSLLGLPSLVDDLVQRSAADLLL